MNVAQKPLVDPQKIVLPPLHVKLDIVNHFVRAMDMHGEASCFLKRKFPKFSEAKIKEILFQGQGLMLD